VLLRKKSQLPHYTAFMILEESLFWFMTGKSSWVHSRTQGSIPMLFCRWADVLWLLHSLLVPSNGWWLDQGRWSLYLLFCCCGNDQTMALYQTNCVCYFKTMMLPLLLNLVCNNYIWTLMYLLNVANWMYLWMAIAELITILAVCLKCALKSFKISRATGIIWA
jgi:hypothetical protein